MQRVISYNLLQQYARHILQEAVCIFCEAIQILRIHTYKTVLGNELMLERLLADNMVEEWLYYQNTHFFKTVVDIYSLDVMVVKWLMVRQSLKCSRIPQHVEVLPLVSL